MKIYDMEQGSDEWFAVRCGKLTASNFATALAGGQGKTRATLMRKLIAERLTDEPQATYKNEAMERGNEIEPLAREYYELMNECDVKQVGFIELYENIGCSPDGLVGEDGMLEIKCPNSATHIEYILDDRLPPTYKYQVHGQLWISERKWCDFMSYDPRVKRRPSFIKRVYRDEKIIAELKVKTQLFVEEMISLQDKILETPF